MPFIFYIYQSCQCEVNRKIQTGILVKDHVPLHGRKDGRTRSFHILLIKQIRPRLTCHSAGLYGNLP